LTKKRSTAKSGRSCFNRKSACERINVAQALKHLPERSWEHGCPAELFMGEIEGCAIRLVMTTDSSMIINVIM
jgi:hypothetical protein